MGARSVRNARLRNDLILIVSARQRPIALGLGAGVSLGCRTREERQRCGLGFLTIWTTAALPLTRHFEDRLQLVEAYDRAGFYGYHLAEHHNTPLGYAPSPGVFLAAVAQRTRQLRFGPMVYLLPLYHPLRLIDEICMLDQMSGGRFMYGVGRGISPVEVGFYGVDFATGAAQFREAFDVDPHRADRGRADLSRRVLRFRPCADRDEAVSEALSGAVVRARQPGERPWAAANAANTVTRRPPEQVRAIIDGYRAEWKKLGRVGGGVAAARRQPPHHHRRHRGGGARHRAARLPGVAAPYGAAVAQVQRAVPVRGGVARGLGRLAAARRRDRRHARSGARLHRRARSTRPASITMSATSPSARSATTRRCARSSCSRRR